MGCRLLLQRARARARAAVNKVVLQFVSCGLLGAHLGCIPGHKGRRSLRRCPKGHQTMRRALHHLQTRPATAAARGRLRRCVAACTRARDSRPRAGLRGGFERGGHWLGTIAANTLGASSARGTLRHALNAASSAPARAALAAAPPHRSNPNTIKRRLRAEIAARMLPIDRSPCVRCGDVRRKAAPDDYRAQR